MLFRENESIKCKTLSEDDNDNHIIRSWKYYVDDTMLPCFKKYSNFYTKNPDRQYTSMF